MSGYVGYLGKFRHSSDGGKATDIRRISAEHQGIEYVESSVNKAAVKKTYATQQQAEPHYAHAHLSNISISEDTPRKAVKSATDCKVVYKKSRKLNVRH